jgi:phospholipid transport system transporter-binding protein
MRARSDPRFTLASAPAAGGSERYRLAGLASFATASALLARGSQEFAGKAQVEVDLGGIEGADSAGLAVLLTWVERARRDGQSLRFTGLPASLRRIAHVCAAEELLRAAETARR